MVTGRLPIVALHNPVQQDAAPNSTQPQLINEVGANLEKDNSLRVFVHMHMAEAGLEPARGLPPTGF
jgi:hypothetical protein